MRELDLAPNNAAEVSYFVHMKKKLQCRQEPAEFHHIQFIVKF